TMTAESALLGIPTISYNAVPNIIESYLVKKFLVKRETNPMKVCNYIKKIFTTSNKEYQKRVKKILDEMEDPIQKLTSVIKQ
ncbi:MAG: lipid-A-disaccharide synthase, partial [Nitrosopumilus sp.]